MLIDELLSDMTFAPRVTLSEAMVNLGLFGKTFAAESFWPWRVVAKLIDGISLTEQREIELFEQCTGRYNRQTRRALHRLILLAGRRAGKDRFLSAVGMWRAALCADWRKHISAGEQAVVILLGADKKQAAILRRYCRGLLQEPLLAREVSRETEGVIEFKNGASLEVATNDARLVRGRSAIAVLGSECCHWRTDETAASSDEEVVAAAEPSMAMCPDGGLLLLGSSTYRKRGYMYRKFRELHGSDGDGEDLCWLAPSKTMNPKLPQRVVDKALAEDPGKARAEYLSIWREDLSDFLPADVIDASTDYGTYERAPLPATRYVAFADAAGGTGSDSFALAIAHAENDTAVLDAVRENSPRFVPSAVIAEYAELLRAYRLREVLGDRYSIGFHADEWRRHGISFKPCSNTTSENYLSLLPMLLSGRTRLIDHRRLRGQLSALERRAQSGGHETVSHPSTASGHDDIACAVAGAVVWCKRQPKSLGSGLVAGMI